MSGKDGSVTDAYPMGPMGNGDAMGKEYEQRRGTDQDQKDMYRMGKSQQMRVCWLAIRAQQQI